MSNIYPIHVISDPMLPLNVSQGADAGGVFFFLHCVFGRAAQTVQKFTSTQKKVPIAEAAKDFEVPFLIHGKRTTCFNLSF